MMKFTIIKLAPIIENARASFWFVPSVMILSTILLTIFTVYFDGIYIPKHNLSLPLIYGADVEAMRSLLSTIAAAMITVTSIAFSITIVALTLASSQFGPRLLRNFMMDKGTQVVLGAFISNFLYCILLFCAISFKDPYNFTPGLSIATAILMTFLSVVILIYFIHHVAKSIQADRVIDDVYKELQTNIDKLFPSTEECNSPEIIQSQVTDNDNQKHQLEIISPDSGYVQTLDLNQLALVAEENNLLLKNQFTSGDFVIKGAVIAKAYSATPIHFSLTEKVLEHITLGACRTPVQDPEFAIHQLVEIALRALSPGINDPYTAITCVNKLNAVLCGLTKKTFPQKVHCDNAGSIRLISKEVTFTCIGRAAYNQIRQHANQDIAVTIRLLEALHELATFSQNHQQREFVLAQTKMIEQQQNALPRAKDDLQTINQKVTVIKTTLDKYSNGSIAGT